MRFLSWVLLITPLLIGYRFVSPDSSWFYIGMCAGFVSFTACNGRLFATVQDLSPVRMRGITAAVLLLMSSLIGLGLGATLVGGLSDVLASLGVDSPLKIGLLAVDGLAVMALISYLCLCFIGKCKFLKKNKVFVSSSA